MALPPASRLGPYEILGAIGEGGMGEVYRARDTRLGRDVAIKVLPTSVADDPDRRARFEREAKAVAALSHPNILAIFDTGTDVTHGDPAASRPVMYAVTELLEGETLQERLARQGALPVRKAIDIAVQIARGLAAAHEKGLVHRDLKPANVFVLHDGQVKILDFGLARQMPSPAAGSGATETVAATDPGVVMGTVGYMAPEQVRGQAVEARADLFAFGAVLYEMLSGQRAFRRDTTADTMTAILREDPPELSGTRADLSPALDRIVRHCLEKNPGERFQSARDVAFALEALSGTAVTSGIVTAAPLSSGRLRARLLVAGAMIAAAAIGALGALTWRGSPPSPPAFEVKTWDAQWITNARFVSDGQTIVFSAARAGNTPNLFVIRPGSVVSQPLGPAGTQLLAASSTGELAVLTGARLHNHRVFTGTLARMTLDGAQRPVLENVTEADWSPDGQSLAVVHLVAGRSQLEYPMGRKLHETVGYLSDPRVSPDGKRVAFFEHAIPLDDRGWVKVIDENGRVATVTGEYGSLEGLAWSRDGRSLQFSVSSGGDHQPYVVDAAGRTPAHPDFSTAGSFVVLDVAAAGRMLAARNDERHSIRGIAPGASAEQEYPWLDFEVGGAFSTDGRLLAFSDLSQTAGTDYAVSLRGTDGSPVVRLGPGATFGLSPDAKWALSIIPSKQQIVLYPTGAGTTVNLERGPVTTYNYVGQWFADGRRVLLCGNEASGASRCYQQKIDGGTPAPITPDGVDAAFLAPDDKTMLLHTAAGEYVLSSLGADERRTAPGLAAGDRPLAFSRDCHSIFVQVGQGVPARVDQIDLATGARKLAREIAPPDRSGVTSIRMDQWTDGGRVYTYRYVRTLSTLYAVSRDSKR